MRIISGIFGGRKLAETSHLKSLRPTTDKAREALFNILTSANFLQKIQFSLKNSVVLDLCCGTGAVGIEALSRQAKFVSFVDINSNHLEILQKNLALLKIEKGFEVFRADAARFKNLGCDYDLIFLDPPYSANYKVLIENILKNCGFSSHSLVVVEHGKELKNLDFCGFEILACKNYGRTSFSFLTPSSIKLTAATIEED